MLALLYSGAGLLRAQLPSYEFTQTAGTYTPINGTVVADGTTSLSYYRSGIISIPPFTYNGEVFDSLTIRTGAVWFEDAGANFAILNPFYTSLDKVYNSALSNIQYQTTGNETIIQWSGFKRMNCNESFGFQVRLNHITNSITYVYQLNTIPDTSLLNQPVVGLRHGTVLVNRMVNALTGNWDASEIPPNSGYSCRFTSNANNPRYFTTGQTYIWSPSSCPYGYGSLMITSTGASSASVNWQEATPGDFLIEYGPAGFTPGSGNIAGVNGTVVNPATFPVAISGLTPNAFYDFYYRKNCMASAGSYSTNGPKAGYKQGYCTFSSVNPNYYIKNFSTSGAIANVVNLNSGYSPNGYQDTTSAMVITVNSGDSLNYQVEYMGGSNTNIISAAVDWNNDMVFAGSEYVLPGTGNNPLNYTLRVPANTLAGDYRLRVAFTYYVFGSYVTCGTFTGTGPGQPGGEAEDYILRVLNSSCKRPLNITAGFPTESGITLSWSNNGVVPSNNYDIYYSTSNVPPDASTLPSLTNRVSGDAISGLAPATTYYFWVRANCGTEQSTWGWVTKGVTSCAAVSDFVQDFGTSNSGANLPACYYATPQGSSTIPMPGEVVRIQGGILALRPVNNAGDNTHWLRLKMLGSPVGTKLQVGYMADPLNAATFNLIQELTTVSNVYQTFTVDPGTLPGSSPVLALKASNGTIMVDSAYWEVKPSCLPPGNVVLSQPTDTSGYISWQNPLSMPAGNFDIYYSTSSTAPVNATMPVLTNQSNNTSIGGLAPNTTYYFWVRSSCGSGVYSSWVQGNALQTFCTPVTDFVENFDNIPAAIGSLPVCTGGMTTYYPAVVMGFAASPPNAFMHGKGALPYNLKPVSNLSANTHWLRFKARGNQYGGNSIQVGYFTDPRDLGTFTVLKEYLVPGTTYQEYYVDPGTVPGSSKVLGFQVVGPAVMTGSEIILDDIAWEPKPACISPYNLIATTLTQTSGNVTWSAIASQPPLNNYDLYYSTDTTPPLAATVPTLTNQVSGALLSGLTPGTAYYVWIRSNCGAAQTAWVGPDTLNTRPVNDEAAAAIMLTLGAGCQGALYTNISATAATNEPYPSCSTGPGRAPVWFKLQAPPSGAIRVYTTSGTTAYTRIGLFEAGDTADYSTYTIIACNDGGGNAGGTLNNGNNASVLYATGLTPGAVYYIAVDGYFSSQWIPGTFCIQAEELAGNMLSATNTCSSGYQGNGSGGNYKGLISLLDDDGNILALVQQPTGSGPSNFVGKQNVHSGTIRTFSNGVPYLDRNWQISYPTLPVTTNVQLFFSDAEFQALKSADPSISSLNDLTVTKVPSSAAQGCLSDYGQQVNMLLPVSGNGTSADGLVHWLNFTTSQFSNFFISGPGVPLPVDLVDFNGRKEQNGNRLSWKFACDDGQDLDVVLERNPDGKSSFMEVHQTVISSRNCDKFASYLDKDLNAGVYYYRLRYANPDGKVKYSKVIALSSDSKALEFMSIVPNPVRQSATLNVMTGADSKGTIHVTDVAGRVVETRNVDLVQGSNSIELKTIAYAPGFYMITLIDESGNRRSLKMVKE